MSVSTGEQALPTALPIFPLPGALLLPGGKLPLNIFEPRYLAMVRDAMKTDRMIGMIQPRDEADPPALYDIGCAGRITSFTETDDGRYLITLTGVSRFQVVEEMERTTPYRLVRPDFRAFVTDKSGEEPDEAVNRDGLLVSLKRYLDRRGLGADWDAISNAPTGILINSLAMICPFGVPEKQALLEAKSLDERARTMVALMEFAIAEGDNDNEADDPPGVN
ncbi:MAG: LON peptidase substrate-binding domain-containing protein [Rhodothalassiaceae bacterium]